MRRLNLILLLSAVTAAILRLREGIMNKKNESLKNTGLFLAFAGPAVFAFILWEEDGKYRVTVMHRNHTGGSEAETYLVRETEGVLFIETGFAVMMDYDREKDRIRLSPGGEYRRKSDGTLKQ